MVIHKSKKGKEKYVNSDSDESNDELDELEALMARIFPRGSGKHPIIYFSCNKVGHIAAA